MLYSINKHPTLSHEFINTYVSDYDIYAFYLGGTFIVGKPFNSPFHEDRTPSFGIYEIQGGKLLYKDYSKGLNGNAITFVQEILHLSTFKEAIVQIYSDLILDKKKIPLAEIKSTKEYKQSSIDIGVTRQPFNKADLEWWRQFNISKEILDKFEVSPAKYMFVGPYIKHEYTPKDPMYVYKVYDKLKIYRPISIKKEKWYGSLTRNYIHGYKQLPETGDLLIITKSLKDVMCLYSLGYTAISPSSEGTLIPEHIMNKLKKRFKHIIVFYDNDEAGIAYSDRMCKRYNLLSCMIAPCEEVKDTSDFFKKYKEKQTKDYLKFIFNNALVSENKLIQDETKNTQKESVNTT